jgi:hypothetical protein
VPKPRERKTAGSSACDLPDFTYTRPFNGLWYVVVKSCLLGGFTTKAALMDWAQEKGHQALIDYADWAVQEGRVTEKGRVLTDEVIEALAKEAERGYNVDHLTPKKGD